MKYALFLGCTIPSRALNYELSTRKVAEVLGIELVDLDFGCCGFPLAAVDEIKAFALAAGNLSLAKKHNLPILALCSACAEALTKTETSLAEREDLSKRVNRLLKTRLGLEYRGGVSIKHFARFLYEDFGIDNLKKIIKRPLKGVKIANHYGCHYMRPSEVYQNFDDPLFPVSLDLLVEATGAENTNYKTKMECCGGAIAGMNENIAMKLAETKLDDLSKIEVDAMVVICPFCSIMYDKQQVLISEAEGKNFEIPVLYYPQLLGLALGIEPDELGFDLNATSVEKLLKKIGVEE